MNVRYAPGALQRVKDYQADLQRRVQAGVLTRDEMATLLSARMREEAEGAEPRRVKCPSCGAAHTFVGKAQQFACPCSPEVHRSVWDCRLRS